MAGIGDSPAALIPHREPARFVTDIVSIGRGTIVCDGRIPRDSPYVEEGRVPSHVALEFAGQAAAVLESIGRATPESDPEPRIGYLVRARNVVLSCPDLPAGAQLRAHLAEDGAAFPLTIYDVRVELGDREILTASITTVLGEGT
jgi:predicted hotdog family 3-hydroxylacyl-ACP dehydratase